MMRLDTPHHTCEAPVSHRLVPVDWARRAACAHKSVPKRVNNSAHVVTCHSVCGGGLPTSVNDARGSIAHNGRL